MTQSQDSNATEKSAQVPPPRVSVVMITYNHEKYIGQAIESVLSQSLQEVEVVVGEDCSPDNTRAIAEEIAVRDPRVRVLDTPTNLGGRRNYERTMFAARGDYINQLDGDDYFTDPDKLKLQVQLLDENPELSGCFAASQRVSESGELLNDTLQTSRIPERVGLLEFVRYCMTDSASMMYRRDLWVDKLPDWFHDPPQGDWPLHVMNAERGDFGYINRILSAYRIHVGGVWNKKSEIEKIKGNLECQRHFIKNLKPENVASAHHSITRYLYRLVRRLLRHGDVDEARVVLEWIQNHGSKDMSKFLELKTKLRFGLAKLRAK